MAGRGHSIPLAPVLGALHLPESELDNPQWPESQRPRDRKSVATAMAAQKITVTPKTPSETNSLH